MIGYIYCEGALQGSIFGSFVYSVHSNGLLDLVIETCDVYNYYDDDNTLCCYGNSVTDVIGEKLENVSEFIKWFNDNLMKLNSNKFQLKLIDR